VSGPAFQGRTAAILAVICTISLVGLGLLAVFGPEFAPTRSGEADVFSASAVGHGALYDLLEELDIPTVVHRNPKRPPLDGSGVVLVLEPHLHLSAGKYGRPGLAELVSDNPAVLLALPKWQVLVDDQRNPHVKAFAPMPTKHVLGPLEALGVSAELVRVQVDPEVELTPNTYGEAPHYEERYRQYIASEAIEPLIGDREHMLLGVLEYEGVPVYVLSDPDLIANHGLHHPPNAKLAVTWIDALRDGGPVAFDETLHGFPPRDESLLRELFRFPLVLLLLHALFAVALVLWAGLRGFGDAPPPPPQVEPGSEFLIRHTAYLLRFGGHRDMALRRYTVDVGRDVALRFRLPTDLRGPELDERLDALGASRGTKEAWSQLKQRALDAAQRGRARSDGGRLRVAHDLYMWKREILDGTRRDSRNTQPTA